MGKLPENQRSLIPEEHKPDSTYTLAEVGKHCTRSDFWVALHGKVYDLTEFLDKHPGGDPITLAAGRDATILFETYHVRSIPATTYKEYKIGTLENTEDSYYDWSSPFYPTLKQRVVTRLRELHKARRGGAEIYLKSIMLLTWFWGSLYVMCFAQSFQVALLGAVSMGAAASFVGTCIQHDGSHGAFSPYSHLNKAAGWTLDMIGASAFTWEFQHMLGHHPYTNLLDVEGDARTDGGLAAAADGLNIQENDPDVFSSFPFVRMHPSHKRQWIHRYQHIYAPVLFSLMTLSKVYHQDWDLWKNKRLYHINAECRYGERWNSARFLIMKVLSCGYMLVLPCWCRGSLSGVPLYLVGHLVCGEMLALMFIVNHVIEGVAFAKRERDDKGKILPEKPATAEGVTPMEATNKMTDDKVVPLNDWAAVQCQTSVNWAAGSWFWSQFSGGLSHQIEHHLFPGLCHTNYVHIQSVVEETCAEFGVPYQNEASLGIAIVKMLRHLKNLGTQDFPHWDSSE